MSTFIALYRGPISGSGYSLTDDDVLWLARGFVGEAGQDCSRKEAAYHFWCWMNRRMLMKAWWNTAPFWKLLRAHSQPLNEIWSVVGGEKCAHSSTGMCAPERIAHRKWVQSLTVSQLKALGVYQYAVDAQMGDLERPTSTNIYDFGECGWVASQGYPCTGINIDGECFLTYECLKPDQQRSVVKGSVEFGEPVKKLGISALGVIFGAAVLWALWKLEPWKKLGKR